MDSERRYCTAIVTPLAIYLMPPTLGNNTRNLPRLSIRRFGASKVEKPFWAEPCTPFPADVVRCTNTVWERAGTNAAAVSTFGIQDALGLLLEQGPVLNSIVGRTLHALLVNSRSLMLAIGQSHHQGHVHPVGKKYASHPLLLPSIFGLLLAKLGRMKGDYMKGAPFLVGRLLGLADQLHVQYCYGVRKGQVPPQLVGNALMVTAMEQPVAAVAMLFQRIRPYYAWACTIQEGENVALAKYLLGQIGRVTAELTGVELPQRCSDKDKAEMVLGYLAHPERSKENETNVSTNSEGTEP